MSVGLAQERQGPDTVLRAACSADIQGSGDEFAYFLIIWVDDCVARP